MTTSRRVIDFKLWEAGLNPNYAPTFADIYMMGIM